MSNSQPLVSIYTTCKNAKHYVVDTIQSITSQTYQNIEIVVADGASTDGTIELFKELAAKDPRIKFHSEPDADASEGFIKAMNRATGKYLMMLPISDVYLNRTWVESCVKLLESNHHISMVHGCPVNINDEGAICGFPFPKWLSEPPPSGTDFSAFYFATFSYVSELSYCLRREVYLKCFPTAPCNFPKEDTTEIISPNPDQFLWLLHNFFKRGYLAAFIPVVASGGRLHDTSRNNKFKKFIRAITYKYSNDIRAARWEFLFGKGEAKFLDSDSNVYKQLNFKEKLSFAALIGYYRLANLPMFGQRYNLMFLVTISFQFFVLKPTSVVSKIWKKVQARL